MIALFRFCGGRVSTSLSRLALGARGSEHLAHHQSDAVGSFQPDHLLPAFPQDLTRRSVVSTTSTTRPLSTSRSTLARQ